MDHRKTKLKKDILPGSLTFTPLNIGSLLRSALKLVAKSSGKTASFGCSTERMIPLSVTKISSKLIVEIGTPNAAASAFFAKAGLFSTSSKVTPVSKNGVT